MKVRIKIPKLNNVSQSQSTYDLKHRKYDKEYNLSLYDGVIKFLDLRQYFSTKIFDI